MIRLEDIQSLSEFQRNAKATVARLNKTGRPSVLTVNGRAQCVVLGTKRYEEMAALFEQQEALAGIRKSLQEIEAGEVEPGEEVHSKLRARLKARLAAGSSGKA